MAGDRIPSWLAQDPAFLLKQINDILPTLQAHAAGKITAEVDSDDLPTASEALLGTTYMVKHSATETSVQMCCRDSTGAAFQWVELGKTTTV